MTGDEGRELAECARQKGVVLHHGAKGRYHDDHHIDVENVQRVGELLHGVTVTCWDYGPERKWYGDRALSGGSFALMPYHVLIFIEAFGSAEWATGWEGSFLHRLRTTRGMKEPASQLITGRRRKLLLRMHNALPQTGHRSASAMKSTTGNGSPLSGVARAISSVDQPARRA